MESKKKGTPSKRTTSMEERDEAGRKRLEDLPDQPQERLVRGFGAMNPIEGDLGTEGEEGKR